MPNFLSQLTQPCNTTFVLRLANLTVLSCQKVVRVAPQKRVVCQALWQGKLVYAKLFFGENASKYAARDAAGVKWLVDANIDTPHLFYQGEAAEKNAYVLIFEAIAPANNVEEIWPTLTVVQRIDLLKKLVIEVAKHHNAGLIQTDLYFKNFLVTDNRIYTIDGDGIRLLSFMCRAGQTQHNLATLFSKMDTLDDDLIYDAYAAYCQQRGIEYSTFDEAKVWVKTQKIRRQAAGHYADKKVFRQCSDVDIVQQKNLFIASSSRFIPTLSPQNIEQVETYFTKDNLLKDGNTCTVVLAEIDHKKIVIKRYNIKGFWHGVSRAFRQTRAAASWANAHRLNILGAATAAPVALIEERKFGFLKLKAKAYFLAEYVDAPDVAEFFANTRDKTERAEAVKNIAQLFYKLFLLQISHGDMKASNIKMQGTQPVLIDLDSMRQHRNTNVAAHVRDLQRFMQNWQEMPSLYNAFVKTFKVIYPDDSMLIKAGIATNKERIK